MTPLLEQYKRPEVTEVKPKKRMRPRKLVGEEQDTCMICLEPFEKELDDSEEE